MEDGRYSPLDLIGIGVPLGVGLVKSHSKSHLVVYNLTLPRAWFPATIPHSRGHTRTFDY